MLCRKLNNSPIYAFLVSAIQITFSISVPCPALLLGSHQKEEEVLRPQSKAAKNTPDQSKSVRCLSSSLNTCIGVINYHRERRQKIFSSPCSGHGCHVFFFLEWRQRQPPSPQPPCAGTRTQPSPAPAQRRKEVSKTMREERGHCLRWNWCLGKGSRIKKDSKGRHQGESM